jgi:hypothetical protein
VPDKKMRGMLKAEMLLDIKSNVSDSLLVFLHHANQVDFPIFNIIAFADLFDYNDCVRGLLFVKIFSMIYDQSDSIKKYFIMKKNFIKYCFTNLLGEDSFYNNHSHMDDKKAKHLGLLSLATASLFLLHVLLDHEKQPLVAGKHFEHGKKIIQAMDAAKSDKLKINLGYKDYDSILKFLCAEGFVDELCVSDICDEGNVQDPTAYINHIDLFEDLILICNKNYYEMASILAQKFDYIAFGYENFMKFNLQLWPNIIFGKKYEYKKKMIYYQTQMSLLHPYSNKIYCIKRLPLLMRIIIFFMQKRQLSFYSLSNPLYMKTIFTPPIHIIG